MTTYFTFEILGRGHCLNATDEVNARLEAQRIVEREQAPEHIKSWAGFARVVGTLREVRDVESFVIYERKKYVPKDLQDLDLYDEKK